MWYHPWHNPSLLLKFREHPIELFSFMLIARKVYANSHNERVFQPVVYDYRGQPVEISMRLSVKEQQ